jgi:hypothetical protein
MERMQKFFPQYYNFHPRGFVMPSQSLDLVQFLQSPGRPRTVIVKPDLGAQGRGIILIQDPDARGTQAQHPSSVHFFQPALYNSQTEIKNTFPIRMKFTLQGVATATSVVSEGAFVSLLTVAKVTS